MTKPSAETIKKMMTDFGVPSGYRLAKITGATDTTCQRWISGKLVPTQKTIDDTVIRLVVDSWPDDYPAKIEIIEALARYETP